MGEFHMNNKKTSLHFMHYQFRNLSRRLSVHLSLQNITIAIATLAVFLCVTTNSAQAYYSNAEFNLSSKHDFEFHNRLNQIFFSNQKLDIDKIKNKIKSLSSEKEQFAQWQYVSLKTRYIEKNNLNDEKASKKANKQDEGILVAYDEVIRAMTELCVNANKLSAQQITDETSRILMLLIPLETIDKSNIFTNDIYLLKKMTDTFYRVSLKDQNQLQASNLLLKNSTSDLSKVDPADSALWTNNNIESYDPKSEIFYGQKLFPEAKQNVIFKYKMMGRGSPKIKVEFNDQSFSVKLGREVSAEILAAQLARSVGYPSIPLVYRNEIILDLEDTTFEQFLAQWKIAHGNDGFHNFSGRVEKLPSMNGQNNLVRLKQVALEAYPNSDLYNKLGPFRSARNGLNNRREYRAQLLYAALINWSDSKERNIRADMYRETINSAWKPLYFLNDIGMSMGDWYSVLNPGAVNTYRERMSTKIGDTVFLQYLQVGQHPDTWSQATASDLKWLIRRYSRLSDQQIDLMTQSSGFPKAVQALYAEKIKRRLNNLIKNFKLDNELKSFTEHSYRELQSLYPEYINEEGKLNGNLDEDTNPTTWYNGSRMTYEDALKLLPRNYISKNLLQPPKKMLEILQKPIRLGSVQLSNGIKFGCSRTVDINIAHGPGENRYLTTDECTYSVPLGYVEQSQRNSHLHIELPFNVYANWSYSYKHSYASIHKAFSARISDMIVPRTPKYFIDHLENGHTLQLAKSYSFSLGGLGLELNKDFVAKIAPVRYFKAWATNTIISKNQDSVFEVQQSKNTGSGWSTGFDFSAYIKMRFETGKEWQQPKTQYYRFDLKTVPEETARQAINDLVLEHKSNANLLLAKFSESNANIETAFSNKSLLVWDWNQSTADASTEFTTNIDHPVAITDHVFTTQFSKQQGRDLQNLWTDELNPGSDITSVVDYVTRIAAHGTETNLNIEGVANKNFDGFDQLQIQININRKANWVTRSEFQKDYIEFFKNRSGEKNYFNFSMPQSLKYYSPLEAQMKWQFSNQAVQEMMTKLIKTARTPDDGPRTETLKYKAGQIAENIQSQMRQLKKVGNLDQRKQMMSNIISKLRLMVKMATDSLNQTENLRPLVQNDNIWITCKILNALEYTMPAAIENDLFVTAPEIGHYQGPSYLHNKSFQFIDGFQTVH